MMKPVETMALVALSMAAAPEWSAAQDWYFFQGIFMGAALGAIVSDTSIQMRLWRIAASFIVGYMCAGFFINWLGQDTREGIRFISGLTSFSGFAAAKAIEMAMPNTFKRVAKAASNELVTRVSGVGLGDRDTDRASDLYAAVAADKALNKKQGGSDET